MRSKLDQWVSAGWFVMRAVPGQVAFEQDELIDGELR
jgi:hypothetical protein